MTGQCFYPAFTGTYNFVNSGDEFRKAPALCTELVERGARLYGITGDRDDILPASDVAEFFDRRRSSDWVGRLELSPELVQSVLDQYATDFTGDPEWVERVSDWHKVAKEYTDLWITIDWPGQIGFETAIISYWMYPPYSDPKEDNSEQGLALDETARVLVDDVYVAIDNLFSLYVFEAGQFAYPNNELRKLSFTYIVHMDGDPASVVNNTESLWPLLKKTLIPSSPEDVSATTLKPGYVLMYTRGFIGMTGQPTLGKTPVLQVLVGPKNEATSVNLSGVLHTLVSVEKAGAYINMIGEHILPAIKEENEKASSSVRAIAGTVEQLKIDVDLCTKPAELSTLAGRESLLATDINTAFSGVQQLREYLTDFFSNGLRVRDAYRRAASELGVDLAPEDVNFLTTRLQRVNRAMESISEPERDIQKTLNKLQSAHTMASGVRTSLRAKYQELSTGRSVIEDTFMETCFVLMPFREELDEIYREIVLPLFEKSNFGLRCYRADDIYGTSPIMQDVWSSIKSARIVIAELTGRNPNVLYELGLAHVLRKPCILLTQSMSDVPFDLQHLRCITYSLGPRGLNKLKSDLEATVHKILEVDTREVKLFQD